MEVRCQAPRFRPYNAGQKLGDSQNDVLEKCGDPSYKVGSGWIYDMGLSKPLKVIHFGGADVFRPVVIRMEQVEQLGSGDEP